MGSKGSKKLNKDIEKQKICKVGLSLGRNAVKVEGNFQFGYHTKTDKKYAAVEPEKHEVDAVTPTILATIPEEDGEEEGEGNE